MNKKKILSMLLVMVMLFSQFSMVAADTESTGKITIISQEINDELESSKQVTEWDDSILYTSVTPELSYCSQLTPEGKIQFSYVRTDNNIVVQSDIYDVNDIYNQYNITKTYTINDYNIINNIIIENITDFNNVTNLNGTLTATPRGFSDLDDAIIDAFGANYSAKAITSAAKVYNNKTYSVLCDEDKTTSSTTPDTYYFAKDTALTAIVAWLIGGSWSWISLSVSLLVGVVTTIVTGGIRSTVNSFTAERSIDDEEYIFTVYLEKYTLFKT